MGIEPTIPDNAGNVPDDSGYSEEQEQKPENGEQPANKAGEGDAKANPDPNEKTDSERLKVSEEKFEKLVEGWKDDREHYQGEIKRLRSDANSTKLTSREEDELEGLDEDQRVEKIIELREAKKKALNDAELKVVDSEIRFYERTSTEFSDNKKAILKVAEDYNCRDLKQAILVFRGLKSDASKKNANYHNDRKKSANGMAGGKSGGKPVNNTPYSKKEDGNKSFGDLFRAGGVK